ncbi:hypothetical protein ACIBG6_16460 [Streptomyces sp. NPDC050842]
MQVSGIEINTEVRREDEGEPPLALPSPFLPLVVREQVGTDEG